MAKRKQIGVLGALALSAATILGGAEQVNALTPVPNQVTTQQNKKEAIPVEKKVVTPQAEKNRFGGYSGAQNPYKHIRKEGRNQRQYRKWLRSNPHMRRSKKSK